MAGLAQFFQDMIGKVRSFIGTDGKPHGGLLRTRRTDRTSIDARLLSGDAARQSVPGFMG